MTDNEIIKALERLKSTKDYLRECYQNDLKNCKYPEIKPLIKDAYEDNKQAFDIAIKAIEDYNRQKAEIERLTGSRNTDPMDFCGVLCRYAEELINKAKAEAVKEFAERLKETGARNNAGLIIFVESDIDRLEKELVGETDV